MVVTEIKDIISMITIYIITFNLNEIKLILVFIIFY